MSTKNATPESGIDLTAARFQRAVTQDMTVTAVGPGVCDVTHDGETYRVELESAHCGGCNE